MTAKKQIISRARRSVPPPWDQSSFSLPLPPSPLHFNPRTAYTGSRCQEPRQPGLAHERVALCLCELQHQFKQPRLCEGTAPPGKAPGTGGHSSMRCCPFPSQRCPPAQYCTQLKLCRGCCTPAGQRLSQEPCMHQRQSTGIKKALRSHNPTLFPGNRLAAISNPGVPPG